MFAYSTLSETAQKNLKNSHYRNLVKVRYNDPNPVLKDYLPNPCVLPELFKPRAEFVKEFPVRKDDVWILSYPKTGTTWTTELTKVLLNGMDFEKLDDNDVTEKVMLFE